MGKLAKKDIEELREFLDLECEYAGTEEIVDDITRETLKELGSDAAPDEVGMTDGDDEFAGLDEFIRLFWGKAVDKIMNVVETQGR